MIAIRERPAATEVEDRSDPVVGRVGLLAAVLVLPLVVVAVRMAHVQLVLPPRFEAAWAATREVHEPVPARTGRLLAADGVVLAHDVARYDLELHYRWLEVPPDPLWIKRHALARLTTRERRSPAARAAAEAAVLADRERLHDDLRALMGDRFESRRAAIQRRIDRMRRVVIDTRRQRETDEAQPDPTGTLAQRWWTAFTTELTTPPRRSLDHFELKEETDFHLLQSDVSPELVALVESAPARFAGLRVRASLQRRYPRGDSAAQVVGYRRVETQGDDESRNELGPAGAEDRADFDRGGSRGQAGLERSLDRQLRGVPGDAAVTLDWAGVEQSRETVRQPRHGRDAVLTLHSGWQRDAEAILDEAIQRTGASGGVVLLVDCWSGAVRAAAAGPRVDPNLYLRPDPERWRRHVEDARQPFFPRLSQMALPPGSTFKLLTAVAALESGFSPSQSVFCQGYLKSPERQRCAVFVSHGVGHGEIALPRALADSCNVFFFTLADTLGEPRLLDWASRAGFGWTTGCELPREAAGSVPQGGPRGEAASRRRQLAIGQGALTVTPLQLARFTSALANGGQLVTPHFLEDSAPPAEPIRGLTPTTLLPIREGLRAAVAEGTARELATAALPVAGKTGTAETGRLDDAGRRRTHGSFVGYFPADDPRLTVVAVLEHGGSSREAVAMVRRLVDRIAERGDLMRW